MNHEAIASPVTLRLYGNRPLQMHNLGRVYRVVDGSVDLYFLERAGRRRYLMTLDPGDYLFGVPARPGAPKMIAVGAPVAGLSGGFHTASAALDMRLALCQARQVATLMERDADRGPAEGLALMPGTVTAVSDEARLTSGAGLVWLDTGGMRAYLGGMDVSPCRFVPVTPRTLLCCREAGTVRVYDTARLVATRQFARALQDFYTLLYRRYHHDLEQDPELTWVRCLARRDNEERMAEQVISGIADLFGEDAGAEEPTGEAPLTAAVRAVLDAQGLALPRMETVPVDDTDEALYALSREGGFRVRRVQLSGRWWQQDNGPLYVETADGDEPVALLPTRHGYRAVNTATGKTFAVDEHTVSALGRYGFMFYRALPRGTAGFSELFRFAGAVVRREWTVVLVLSSLCSLVGLLIPFGADLIFTRYVPGGEVEALVYLGLGLVVAGLSFGLFSLARGYALVRFETRLDMTLQAAVWDRIMSLRTAFFRDYSSGDLMQRALCTEQIRATVSGVVVTTLFSSVFSVIYLVQLFFFNFSLAAAGLFLALFSQLPLLLMRAKLRYETEHAELTGRITGLLQQLVLGISKLRIAGAQYRVFTVWARLFVRKKQQAYHLRRIQAWVHIWNSVYALFAHIVLFSVMLYRVIYHGDISVAAFIAFVTAFSMLTAALRDLNGTLIGLVSLVPQMRRVAPILAEQPEDALLLPSAPPLQGQIAVEHLSFRYAAQGPLVLDDVSLEILPGQFVAVVGPSGSGKSTLLRLLLGFETPLTGGVYFDGHDLAGLDVHSVRRRIGVVLQNSKLIPGNLFENISGSLTLTMDDAWAAARSAAIEDDIRDMPMGMHTLVSEGMGTLSGGQVQRVLIARALAGKPRIFLLDEATSALDNQTQAAVTAGLGALRLTRVVIAHRLSTIRHADVIFVLEDGKLVQKGTYEELVAVEGTFRRLAQRQLARVPAAPTVRRPDATDTYLATGPVPGMSA